MRRILFGVLIIGLCGAPAFGQRVNQSVEDVKGEIATLFRAMSDAVQKRDRRALEQLFTVDFRFIHATGGVEGRETQIEMFLAGATRTDVPTFDPPNQIIVDGNLAILWRGGQPGQLFSTTVFVKEEGRWRVKATQSTRLPPACVAVDVPRAALDALLGRYDGGGGRTAVIRRDGDKLVTVMSGVTLELTPTGASELCDRTGRTWTFTRGPDSNVTGMELRLGNRVTRATKVE